MASSLRHFCATAMVATLMATNLASAMDRELGREEAHQLLTEQLASGDSDIQMRTLEIIGESAQGEWGTQAIIGSGVLDSGDERVTSRALVALGQLGASEAAAPLAAKASGDVYMATAAAHGMTLLLLANPGVSSELLASLSTLAEHESALVRIGAAAALGCLRGNDGNAKLVTLAENDESPSVRRAAAAALALHGDDPAVADALVRMSDGAQLSSLDASVAEMVVLALGFVTTDKRDAAMTNAISALSHADANVRMAAISSAANLATETNSNDHRETVSKRAGSIGANQSREAKLELEYVEALALRLAVLSGQYDLIDPTMFPQYFSEDSVDGPVRKEATERIEKAMVSNRAAFAGLPVDVNAAREHAERALESLNLRASRALFETALYKASDVQSETVVTAIAIEKVRKEGKVEKSGVMARLEEYVAGLREHSESANREYMEGYEKTLSDLQVRFTDTAQHWDARIEAAGHYLQICRQLD